MGRLLDGLAVYVISLCAVCRQTNPFLPMPCSQLRLQELSWQEALQEVVAESSGGEAQELPEAVLQQVQGSPVLLNLATSLAQHKRLLAAVAAQQAQAAGDPGVPLRLREQLRSKTEDLSSTLRTILCL